MLPAMMRDFVRRLNIERFERLWQAEPDLERKKMIMRLLEEERKGLRSPAPEKPRG
jgi:hypothetical protein